MKSIGFILSLIGALLIIYYLMNLQSGNQADVKKSKEVVIEREKVDIRNLDKLKKALDNQAKNEEERMRREIEKQTGGN